MIAWPKTEVMAIVLALCAGAFFGAVAAVLPFTIFGHRDLSIAPVAFLFAAPVIVTVGVPTYYLLKRTRALRWPIVAIAGAILGPVVAGLLTTNSSPPYFSWLYFGAIGMITACSSLFVFRRSDPSLNRDVPCAGLRPPDVPPAG